jgi:hypothetical protein
MQKKMHMVVRLTVHDENQQQVFFGVNEQLLHVLRRASVTMLTTFFALCDWDDSDGVFAQTLLYHELQVYFVWKKNAHGLMHWARRQRGGETVIGRMISVSSQDSSRYHLRMLLCYRKGPKSFCDLRLVNGVECDTFKAAALALGLLENDTENNTENDRCLREASLFHMPRQLRQLFSIILVYCDPADVLTLWESHDVALSKDYERSQPELPPAQQSRLVELQVLLDMDHHLISNGKTFSNFEELPQVASHQDLLSEQHRRVRHGNRLLKNESAYDPAVLEVRLESVQQFTEEQRCVYESVVDSALRSDNDADVNIQKLFLLDGPKGQGSHSSSRPSWPTFAAKEKLRWRLLEVVSQQRCSPVAKLLIPPSSCR